MALTGCNVSLFFFLGFTKHYFGVWESMGWAFGGFWQRLRQVCFSLFSRHRSHLHTTTRCGNQKHPFHDPSTKPFVLLVAACL